MQERIDSGQREQHVLGHLIKEKQRQKRNIARKDECVVFIIAKMGLIG